MFLALSIDESHFDYLIMQVDVSEAVHAYRQYDYKQSIQTCEMHDMQLSRYLDVNTIFLTFFLAIKTEMNPLKRK